MARMPPAKHAPYTALPRTPAPLPCMPPSHTRPPFHARPPWTDRHLEKHNLRKLRCGRLKSRKKSDKATGVTVNGKGWDQLSKELPSSQSIIISAKTGGGIDTSVTKPNISGYVMFCFEITLSVVGWKLFFSRNMFIVTNFSLIN